MITTNQTTSSGTDLDKLLDLAYKGLRDWETPDNRYRALEAIDKFRAQPAGVGELADIKPWRERVDLASYENNRRAAVALTYAENEISELRAALTQPSVIASQPEQAKSFDEAACRASCSICQDENGRPWPCARQRVLAPSASLMQPLSAGLPSPDDYNRVLVYTDGADFAGEQYFDIKTEDLWEIDPETKTEVVDAATHWMPLPSQAGAPAQAQPDLRDWLKIIHDDDELTPGDRLQRISSRIQAALSASPSAPAVQAKPVYQVQMPGEQGSSTWHDATEAAFHTFMPEHRRTLYTGAAPADVFKSCTSNDIEFKNPQNLNINGAAPAEQATTASASGEADCKRCGGEAMIYVENATTPCPDCQDLTGYDHGVEAAPLEAHAGAVDAAIERACCDLPKFYAVQIELWRGAGSVALELRNGKVQHIEGDIPEAINKAVDAAIAASQQAPAPTTDEQKGGA